MTDLDADSPAMFAGLDTFDIGHTGLGDDSVSSTGPTTTTTAATASPSVLDTSASVGGPTPDPPNLSASPIGIDGSQPSFFNPDSSSWNFQSTPPYDTANTDVGFGAIPSVDFPTWDLPVHLLNQQGLQQQQLYPQSSTVAGVDPGIYAAALAVPTNLTTSGNAGRPDIAPNLRNTLTPAQQERLRSIAMPAHLQYHSPKSAGSPDSSASGHEKGAASSPDAADPKPGSRKRKSSAEVDDDDDDDDLEQPVKKTAHNMIEKRYRTNLNDKIAALRDSVPALRVLSKSVRGEDTTEDREELHGLTPAHKLNKATVLSKATEYIRHLEKRNNRLLEENSSMQARITAFEKLFMAGAITGIANPLQQPPTPMQYAQDAPAFMNTPMATSRGPDPQGMIAVPDDMKRILSMQQSNAGRPYPVPQVQQFGQNAAAIRRQQLQQQPPQSQQSRWNPYFGKLMVGSLAGLMFVEALMENEKSTETPEGRGLFALPANMITYLFQSAHLSLGGHHVSFTATLMQVKLLASVALLVWVFAIPLIQPFLHKSEKQGKQATPVVQAVPSLASPIHVRRQAWLTAIQTVWVPKHSFFLEAAALMYKSIVYMLINGFGKKQEAARIKAWTIALDAQLAGGDVEINSRRLILTLIASGTLPETPSRLMLKALHTRVLFWQLSGPARLANNILAAKWARSYWNRARQLYCINKSLPEETSPEEALPDHLAALLEEDCDEVLNDIIIQRAHNLAWNRPTAHNVTDTIDGMNIVVEDPAVRSPMDAVAAWYSSKILHDALTFSLAASQDAGDAAKEALNNDIPEEISLAIKLAPIGSNAQIRALVARTVLISEKRGVNIATALHAMDPSVSSSRPSGSNTGKSVTLVDAPTMTSLPLRDDDAQMALRCAMAMAHLQRFAEPSADTFSVIRSILPLCEAQINEPGLAGHGGMSLLGYTAAFHLMEQLEKHAAGRDACAGTLERLAGALRIWVGSAAGEKAGLEGKLRQRMIDRCLGVTKSIMGMETNDPGYVSMEDDCDEDGDGC